MAPGVSVRTQLCCTAALIWLACFQGLQAQQTSVDPAALTPVPRLVWFSGAFRPANGLPIAPVESVTLAVYSDQQGGNLVWQETQNVVVGAEGRYNLLMGSTLAEGLPLDLFTTGEPRWLAVRFNRPDEVDQPRVHLASVPYALKAADADTLGGKPASAYLLAPTGAAEVSHTATADVSHTASANAATTTSTGPTPNVVLPGTANVVAKYVNSADVGPSALYEAGGLVGINTTTPFDALHVRFTNTNGGMTGLAVQNLGNTPTSYSGMLFYDQNGALGQFQGFNNSTHEYRINNVASSGSVNFMLGSASKFFVAPNGNIGIGTTAPSALLEVSNALPGGPANMWVTSYTNAVGPYYLARRARGTPGAPTAVQAGDGLAGLYGQGYGTTAFGPPFIGGMTVQAAQNWTDTAQGSALTFTTTSIGSTSPTTRMTVDATGFLGIGTTTTPAAGVLEVSNAGNIAPWGSITGSSFTGSNPAGTVFIGRKARGTSVAPAAVLSGDNLVGYLGEGYGATAFSGTRGGMFVQAAENWTDTAQGSRVFFNTTATGTTTPGTKMAIDPNGDVGIGTPAPSAPLEVSRTGSDAGMLTTVYTNGSNVNAFYNARYANGTSAAPTAVQSGNAIGVWAASGYGATQFGSNVVGGMVVAAQENFTDAAQGSATGLLATPLGSVIPHMYMAVMPSGNVGIGDWPIPNPVPTAADKLQVFGDVRVGTSGTNGCVKNFTGTGIIGTCSSDRRLKRDITPFGSVLNQLTTLQPVHFSWRAAEFPDRHFGDSRAYGLIAQDVEQVLPELVVTNDDGFKAVDYSKLPLLTIQAVKELKAENEMLKQRLTELERLIAEMRPTSSRR
jgi:hypothetical protein